MTQGKVIHYQELLEDFIFSRCLRSKSVLNYRQILNRLQTAVNRPVDELDRMSLLKWRKRELDKGLSPISWNNYTRHLKAIFNHGINHGLLTYETNPFNELS